MHLIMASVSQRTVDDVLAEAEFHIARLDQCVTKLAELMSQTENRDELENLTGEALDANTNATTLADLKMLLLDQKRSEGGGASVPTSVLDMLRVGRESCEHHARRLLD